METPVPEGLSKVSEGKASILFKQGEVFYNPIQEYNRDLTVMMLRLYQQQREREGSRVAMPLYFNILIRLSLFLEFKKKSSEMMLS